MGVTIGPDEASTIYHLLRSVEILHGFAVQKRMDKETEKTLLKVAAALAALALKTAGFDAKTSIVKSG